VKSKKRKRKEKEKEKKKRKRKHTYLPEESSRVYVDHTHVRMWESGEKILRGKSSDERFRPERSEGKNPARARYLDYQRLRCPPSRLANTSDAVHGAWMPQISNWTAAGLGLETDKVRRSAHLKGNCF
jgi:hypothetical protein